MKTLIVLAALVAAACALRISDDQVKTAFDEFKAKHGKSYESEEEEAHRMAIFKEKMIRISKHNARFEKGEVTYKIGINKFSDMLTHEVNERLNGYRMDNREMKNIHQKSSASPLLTGVWGDIVDWRTKGYVTPIKDQGNCGSCWSFSTTGALEGQYFKKTGKLISLSEQNLVDCSGKYGNDGCNGGWPYQAMEYIRDNGGIDTESSYPYTGVDGTCSYKASNSGAEDTGYVGINPTEADLEDAVTNVGPISIAIDASNESFHDYESGVYYEPMCSSESLDHAVLIVGYGRQFFNKNYWIVKNSWGTSWGENGYIKMSRNRDNNCGVATKAAYPTV